MINIEKLEEEAVNFAVNAEWSKAIILNNKIIEIDSENLNAFLRNGYANLQLNNLLEAKKNFETVIELQPKNIIAEDHLEKIKLLLNRKKKKDIALTKFNPDLFIEIPGKTKTVTLVNLGQKEDLATLYIGQEVSIKEKRRKLEVRNPSDEYIGSLPDDISKRLSYFIKEGSKYEAHIKEVGLTSVVIFIREISKGRKVKQYPSFPTNPHIMLSDINQISDDDDETVRTDPDQESDANEEDSPAINDGILDLDENDEEEWEDIEEEKDLGQIVHLEDQGDEEDE
jgi:tetratricopeptide (TPR) repeat protein